MRVQQISIGFFSLIYGLTALLVVWWGYTYNGVVGWRVLVLGVFVSAVFVGVLWMVGPWPTETQSLAFVIYADVSVFAVVMCCEDGFTAMPGLALLAANGIYAVVFHGPRVLLMHLLFTVGAFAWIVGVAVEQGTAPATVVVIRFLTLFPTVMGVPVLVQSYLLSLRLAAADAGIADIELQAPTLDALYAHFLRGRGQAREDES